MASCSSETGPTSADANGDRTGSNVYGIASAGCEVEGVSGQIVRLGRTWFPRLGFSFLDQGIVSGATFVINILLARWLAPLEYGAFAVAYTAFLFVSGFHNALILEPMSVLQPAQNDTSVSTYLGGIVWLHLAITACFSIAVFGAGTVVGAGALRGALWGLAIALPVVLMFWLFRRAYYVQTRPRLAAITSMVYAVALLVGTALLWHVGGLSALTALLLMGAASVIACGVGWHRLGMSRKLLIDELSGSGIRWLTREHWRYGRWIAVAALISLAIVQIQTFFVADIVGLDAAGVLRAIQTFSFPMAQLVVVSGYLGVPLLAREAAQNSARDLWRKTVAITCSLVIATVAYAIVLTAFGVGLEGIVYGHRYRDWVWLIPIVVSWPVFSAVGSGFSMTLRALQQSKYYALVGVVTIPIGVGSAWLFTVRWGIGGAAASIVLSEAIAALLTILAYLWFVRRGDRERDRFKVSPIKLAAVHENRSGPRLSLAEHKRD